MADKLSNSETNHLIADAVDAILEEKFMDTQKIDDAGIGELIKTAQRLHSLSESYPGAQSMQQRTIEIKQAFQLHAQGIKSATTKKKIWNTINWQPNIAFSALSALAIIVIIAAIALQGTDSGLVATATSSTWLIPTIVGVLAAGAGLAYWLSKK